MMKFKKILAAAMTGVMMLGTAATAIAVSPSVSAYAAQATTLAVDYGTYEVTITAGNGETYVCLQVLKDKNGSKVTAEYWYPVNSEKKAVVDLSFLKATKTQYIRAYGLAGSESSILEIKAQPKTSIKYDAKTGLFVNGKTKAAVTQTDYDYKTLYGSAWSTDLSTVDLQNSTMAGTTLVIRLKAVTTQGSEAPAGTEVKVKIPAVAKAPKIKVDYKKGTITLPKGVDIAVVDDLTKAVSWTPFAAGGKLTPKQLLQNAGIGTTAIDGKLQAGYTLFVRTSAVTGKKAASNIAVVTFKGTPKLTLDTTNKKIKTTATNDDVTYGFTDENVTLTVNPSATSTFAYSLDGGKKWTEIKGSVVLDVKKNETFKICVPATEDTFASEAVDVTNTGKTTSTP